MATDASVSLAELLQKDEAALVQNWVDNQINAPTFRPDRSQKRAFKANADVELVMGEPEVTDEKLRLYDRFHEFQSDEKGWPVHGPKDPQDYFARVDPSHIRG